MREIQILIKCDACKSPDDAESHTVAIDGGPDKTLDLCGDCTVHLFEPLADLVAAAPRATDDADPTTTGAQRGGVDKRTKIRVDCPVCATTYSAKTIGSHLRDTHGETIGRWNARLGHTVIGHAPLTHWCTACGAAYSDGRGIGQHLRNCEPGAVSLDHPPNQPTIDVA